MLGLRKLHRGLPYRRNYRHRVLIGTYALRLFDWKTMEKLIFSIVFFYPPHSLKNDALLHFDNLGDVIYDDSQKVCSFPTVLKGLWFVGQNC